MLLIGICCIFVVAHYKGVDFIEFDANGNPRISKARQKKLDKELENLEEAEQYVLRALVSKDYPCYSCVGQTKIYLIAGSVYRYGVTLNGEVGRYKNKLRAQDLVYMPQLQGNLTECLKEEKRKIYNYAILPENLARATPLIRPPGNKQDR